MKKYIFKTGLYSLLFLSVWSCSGNKNLAANSADGKLAVQPIPVEYAVIYELWCSGQPSDIFGRVPNQPAGWQENGFMQITFIPQNDKSTVTSGGGGFGVMAILSGINQGYITREEGRQRLEKITQFSGNCRPFSWRMAALVEWRNR